MKLAIVTGDPRQWAGGLNYVLNMSRVLRRFHPDLSVQIFVLGDIPPTVAKRIRMSTGHEPVELPARSAVTDMIRLAGRPSPALTTALRAHSIDVVFEASGYVGNIEQPVVSWLPDFQHRHLPQLFSRTAWLAREMRFRKVIAGRRFLILSSDDARKDMEKFYPPFRGSLHVIPFAIDLEMRPTEEDVSRVRAQWGLTDDYVFLPNQFWAHKNHRLVIEALDSMVQKEVKVVSTGSSGAPENTRRVEELQTMVRDRGLEANFQFLGNVPYAEILALNRGATALINPSMFEGWSTTVEESKALGTPLLLSDLGVHFEQAGDNAHYFGRADAKDCAAKLAGAARNPPVRNADAAAKQNAIALQAYADRLHVLLRSASH
ncbi:glycosyltransferase family 4 protein [Sphingopyxis indica]|uniref:Glycosyltransferase involved in cell wall bisynthesis n=1 Tax=Sphingopyxis indica TaxID=436663 RepID=A0A239D5V4_9SPHN|nr:glycosyltransferase family 1 protein [Sphingopyxis indica]SNS27896.1 Glycosyltransferase involved in cell wall bisynthesis [Sphingopyxis indica]